jgi:hypothetical protein
MRLLASLLAASILAGGCATSTYRISHDELARLVALPPAERGQRVRVDQELSDLDVAAAERVDRDDPLRRADFDIHTTIRQDGWHGGGHGGGGHGGGGHGGVGSLSGGDGKGAAIVVLVAAAVALVVVAGIEGSRFDGDVQLHPMHPVHLFGSDGGYTVVPLAWIDPELASWADRADVRSNEGPWRVLNTAPLWRNGWTYGLYGGTSSLRSASGATALGDAFTVQLGFFPTQELGILYSLFFAWRDTPLAQTVFEFRQTAEVQYLPITVGSIAHAGVYGGLGQAIRREDGQPTDGSSSRVIDGGAMFQLKLHTRIALTARLGVARAHGEQMSDVMFGLSVY